MIQHIDQGTRTCDSLFRKENRLFLAKSQLPEIVVGLGRKSTRTPLLVSALTDDKLKAFAIFRMTEILEDH